MIETFVIVEPVYEGGDTPEDFRFIETNAANARRVNLRRDEIVGKRLLELFPAASREVVRAMKAVIETEKPVRMEYYSQVTDRYTELHAWSPVKGQVAAIGLDVTERVKAEEKLAHQANLLAPGQRCHICGGQALQNSIVEYGSREDIRMQARRSDGQAGQ